MKLPPYPKYKHSGVEWFGDVPENWESKRFGYLFRFYSGGTPSTSESELWDGDLPWVSSKDMKAMVISDTEDHISEDAVRQSSTCKLPAGSLLMVNRSGILRHSIPAAIITREMAINQDIRGCVPLNGVDSKFIAYLIEGNQSALLDLWRQQGATVESLTFESVKTTNLYLPDLAEQRSIAAFLDRETGLIDGLVAKKRELIERLKEKRTALISRTVTRGLPPAAARATGLPENPPMKPSGLDWLGDIPAHWEVKPVKFVTRVGNGSTPSRDNSAYWDGGDYPWLNSSVVNQESVTEAEEFVTALALAECHLPRIQPPAVLVGITGQGRTRGMASTLLFEATINQHLAYLKPLPSRADVGFLRRVFDMAYSFLRSESDGGGSTKGAITCEQIGAMRIPLPPLPEQAAIAAYLDVETAKLDALLGKVEAAVERLQEYRTALITAAVTGKIEVTKVV